MKIVYVCSPLRGNINENIEKANAYCRLLSENGMVPLAPHTIFTQYLDDTIPEQRMLGMAMGMELLKRCDALYFFGNTISEGMRQEIYEAFQLGIPVYQAVLMNGKLIKGDLFHEAKYRCIYG